MGEQNTHTMRHLAFVCHSVGSPGGSNMALQRHNHVPHCPLGGPRLQPCRSTGVSIQHLYCHHVFGNLGREAFSWLPPAFSCFTRIHTGKKTSVSVTLTITGMSVLDSPVSMFLFQNEVICQAINYGSNSGLASAEKVILFANCCPVPACSKSFHVPAQSCSPPNDGARGCHAVEAHQFWHCGLIGHIQGSGTAANPKTPRIMRLTAGSNAPPSHAGYARYALLWCQDKIICATTKPGSWSIQSPHHLLGLVIGQGGAIQIFKDAKQISSNFLSCKVMV